MLLFKIVSSHAQAIVDVKKMLRDHRKQFRRTLGGSYNSLDYITVSGTQVEILAAVVE